MLYPYSFLEKEKANAIRHSATQHSGTLKRLLSRSYTNFALREGIEKLLKTFGNYTQKILATYFHTT